MAEYTLHCFAQSGNAYKAALALELAGADWEPKFVDFFSGASRSPEFRDLNAMGEVPVLEHDGRTLTQSGVILDYLTGTLGKFGPENDDERREILRWTLFDNHKLTSYFATYRFLKLFAPPSIAEPAVLSFFEGRMHAALKVLNGHLAGRNFAVGNRLTTADLSMIGYMFFDEEAGLDLAGQYPEILRWRDSIAAMPGWKHPYDLMPGHPLPAKG